jgi:hypothetical protein
MEKKELQDIYLNALKEEGYKGEIEEDGDIGFKFEGERYWITPDEKDADFFDLYNIGKWDFKDDADKIKGLRALNEVNQTKKLVKIYMNDEGCICTNVGFFVKETKDFILHFTRSLGMIQGAIDSFIEEMEKE